MAAKEPRELWYRTVYEYSRSQLTFEKDRMPALAALAERMGRLRPADRYCAGIWEKSLPLDLLWKVVTPASERSRVRRCPTWSWASVQSAVEWSFATNSLLNNFEVVDIHYIPVGPPYMGEFSVASLDLRGLLVRATLVDRETLALDHCPDCLKDVVLCGFRPDYDYSFPGDHHVPSGSEVFILPIGISVIYGFYAGIVLRREQDRTSYERIGYTRLEHKNLCENYTGRVVVRNAADGEVLRQTQEELMEHLNYVFMNLPVTEVIIF